MCAPTSDNWIGYRCPVAPAIGLQTGGASPRHALHWIATDVGAPSQTPGVKFSTLPGYSHESPPVIAGRVTFTGTAACAVAGSAKPITPTVNANHCLRIRAASFVSVATLLD